RVSDLRAWTTHSWPSRRSLRTMLPPMRPSPIIASCTPVLLSSPTGRYARGRAARRPGRLGPMAVLTTQLVRDETFERRRAVMEGLVEDLRERTADVARGGGEKALERHRARGKLTARERIDLLVDPGSAFLELNALAAWDLYDGQAPAAGIVTGIGIVEGRQCVVI